MVSYKAKLFIPFGELFRKSEKIAESKVQPTELEKRDHYPTSLLPPELQTLFFTSTMLWTCL